MNPVMLTMPSATAPRPHPITPTPKLLAYLQVKCTDFIIKLGIATYF